MILSDAVQKTLDAFCGLNLRYIEELFDATRTTCRITSYRQGLIILFTAEKPVFRIPAGRRPGLSHSKAFISSASATRACLPAWHVAAPLISAVAI